MGNARPARPSGLPARLQEARAALRAYRGAFLTWHRVRHDPDRDFEQCSRVYYHFAEVATRFREALKAITHTAAARFGDEVPSVLERRDWAEPRGNRAAVLVRLEQVDAVLRFLGR